MTWNRLLEELHAEREQRERQAEVERREQPAAREQQAFDVLGVGRDAPEQDVRAKALYRQVVAHARGEVGDGSLGQHQQRIAVGKQRGHRLAGGPALIRQPRLRLIEANQAQRAAQETGKKLRHLAARIEGAAMRAPHLHCNVLAAMVDGDRGAFTRGNRQVQATRFDGGGDQRQAAFFALRDEPPRGIDDHPFAIVPEALRPQFHALAFNAGRRLDGIDEQAGEGCPHAGRTAPPRGGGSTDSRRPSVSSPSTQRSR
jgi:hypothetical protein